MKVGGSFLGGANFIVSDTTDNFFACSVVFSNLSEDH
jgi:hypothetical protein